MEGASDQFYLNGIKNHLIREGLISPRRELVFVPAGGVKGISATVSILTAKDEALPFMLLDSDRMGQDMANKLKNGLYKGSGDRVLMVGDYCQATDAEVEDLMPVDLLADVVTKYLRGPEEDFEDVVQSAAPIIPQIEAYANSNKVILEDGWKVEVARRTKARLLKSKNPLKGADQQVESWKKLFSEFEE